MGQIRTKMGQIRTKPCSSMHLDRQNNASARLKGDGWRKRRDLVQDALGASRPQGLLTSRRRQVGGAQPLPVPLPGAGAVPSSGTGRPSELARGHPKPARFLRPEAPDRDHGHRAVPDPTRQADVRPPANGAVQGPKKTTLKTTFGRQGKAHVDSPSYANTRPLYAMTPPRQRAT